MTYIDADKLNKAFLQIQSKSFSFKTTLVISKNLLLLEKALAPFYSASNEARKKYQDYCEGLDTAGIDAVKKETMQRAYEKQLDSETAEEGKGDCGLEKEKLTPIPAAAFGDKDVSVSELYLLVSLGMITE